MTSSLSVHTWRSSSALDRVVIAPDFHAIVRSEQLGEVARRCLDLGAVMLAAVEGDRLVGYLTLLPSTAAVEARWRAATGSWELGAIEIAEHARRRGIATELLGALPSALPLPSVVLFARAMYSHWAFLRARTSAWRYRVFLAALLGRAGLVQRPTDDPEVADHPLNFLAARIGDDVSPALRRAYLLAERAA